MKVRPVPRTQGESCIPSHEADYRRRERNRLTTFFRLIVAIPWLIVAYIYVIAQMVVVSSPGSRSSSSVVPGGDVQLRGRDSPLHATGQRLHVPADRRMGCPSASATTTRTRSGSSSIPAARQSRMKDLFRLIPAIPLLVFLLRHELRLMAVALDLLADHRFPRFTSRRRSTTRLPT